jgi:hypothetical protein
VEAAICLTSGNKPKEFILAVKLLLQNEKFLDQNFGLIPLKNLPSKQTKIIFAKDNIPSNLPTWANMHSPWGTIFEKKKNWKEKDT